MTTVSGVIPKLLNGADLMMPGVVTNPSKRGKWAFGDGKLNKGDRICVNLADNRAGVMVGTAARDSEDMYMSAGRGKAVIVLHCVGDKLWESGSMEAVPQLGPVEGLSSDDHKEDDEEVGKDVSEEEDDDNETPEDEPVEEIDLEFTRS